MSRTIVVSDLHGYAALLDEALADAGFRPGDRLIVAGDLVDIGPDDCVAAAEERGALILAGNHEVSAALGIGIVPQNPETPARGPEFARHFLSGAWPLAAAVDGWLVTHGGLSSSFAPEIEDAGGDVEFLAARLNGAFREEMRRFLEDGEGASGLAGSRIVAADDGPLWFRAARLTQVPDGLRQVVGHTPCELFAPGAVEALARKPFLLVDPGAHMLDSAAGRFRYAVIEDGEARVVGSC